MLPTVAVVSSTSTVLQKIFVVVVRPTSCLHFGIQAVGGTLGDSVVGTFMLVCT